MHPTDEKPLSVLQGLLKVNNKRLQGYYLAGQLTDVSVLQVLFERLGKTSEQCREELCREVYKLGGVPPECTAGGDFEKAWALIIDALDANDHLAVLDSCYIEEFMTYKSYEYALRYFEQHMNRQQVALFTRQLQLLKQDHHKVSNLREVLLNAA
jgi:uncharacterized protein (TIGR02284 family)